MLEKSEASSVHRSSLSVCLHPYCKDTRLQSGFLAVPYAAVVLIRYIMTKEGCKFAAILSFIAL